MSCPFRAPYRAVHLSLPVAAHLTRRRACAASDSPPEDSLPAAAYSRSAVRFHPGLPVPRHLPLPQHRSGAAIRQLHRSPPDLMPDPIMPYLPVTQYSCPLRQPAPEYPADSPRGSTGSFRPLSASDPPADPPPANFPAEHR